MFVLCDSSAGGHNQCKAGQGTRTWCTSYTACSFSMHFNFTLSSAHMEGAKNSIADVISRTQTGHPSAGGSAN